MFLTVFIDLVGFSILIPVFPLLIGNTPFKVTPASWSFKEGLIMLGFLQAVYPLATFVAAPILGQLSDRYGRRPVLAISILGTAIGYAVFALGNEDDLVRLVARVEALQAFLKTDDGSNLLTGYRRAANILKIEEKKDKREYRGVPDGLVQDEEKELQAALVRAKVETAKALSSEDFAAAMAALAGLRVPVDRFFDKVTVNAEDKNLRENRLMLLSQIVETAHQVADFSKVEG